MPRRGLRRQAHGEAVALPDRGARSARPPRAASAASALESIAHYAPAVEPQAPAPSPIPDDPLLGVAQPDRRLRSPARSSTATRTSRRSRSATDPMAMYGIAIHHAIRVYHQHRMKRLPITADDVITAFEGAWSSEGFYSREHEERTARGGPPDAAALRGARAARRSGCRSRSRREFQFRLGNTLVAGRWDRIDEREDGIVLVDYKTSDEDDPEKADENARREPARRAARPVRARVPADVRRDAGARRAALRRSGRVGLGRRRDEHLEARARARRVRGRRHPRRALPSRSRSLDVRPLSLLALLHPQRGAGSVVT